MIMADILFWFLIIAGVYLTLIAHWLCAHALFPRVVEHCRGTYGRRPVAATLLGLVILLPTLVISIVLAKLVPHPIVQIPVIVLLMITALLSLLGSSGLAARIGSGLAAPNDAAQPWKAVLRGGSTLGLVFLMPLVGWFLLLPWTLISGLGVAAMALRAATRRTAEAAIAVRDAAPGPAARHPAEDTVATVAFKP
jgi:hypothetical protein